MRIDLHDEWQESKHPRGENGKFTSGSSSVSDPDNFDAFKHGKPIGGLSPKDYARNKVDPNFDDPQFIKKGIEFNRKQANARGLAIMQMLKNPDSAKNYAYLWMDGNDSMPQIKQEERSECE